MDQLNNALTIITKNIAVPTGSRCRTPRVKMNDEISDTIVKNKYSSLAPGTPFPHRRPMDDQHVINDNASTVIDKHGEFFTILAEPEF